MQEDIDLKSDNILNVIEKSKEADAKGKERNTQFESKVDFILFLIYLMHIFTISIDLCILWR